MLHRGSRMSGRDQKNQATPNQLRATARKKLNRAKRAEEFLLESARLGVSVGELKLRKAREWAATKRLAVSDVFPDLVGSSSRYRW